MRLRMVGSFVTAMFVLLGTTTVASAEAPWHGKNPWPWSRYEGSRRVDVIGPIGNRLPQSYRRTYNRPSYIAGKIAAKIEPSSQEAMAFHNSEDLGLYDNNGIKGAMAGKNCPPQRVEQHYFYPKPWEVLTVGPRRDRQQRDIQQQPGDSAARAETPSKPVRSRLTPELVAPSQLDSPDFSDAVELPRPADVIMELPSPGGEKE